ncbi:phosphatidylethanolamine-binding protein [Cooperia oncophora]
MRNIFDNHFNGATAQVTIGYGSENGLSPAVASRSHLVEEIDPLTAISKPSLKWNAEQAALYTVVMIDADAPSRKDPHLSEFLHWLVINIPGQSINRGSEEFPYRPPRPPVGTVLVLFQPLQKVGNDSVEKPADIR